MNILAKWKEDWADEFDMTGFVLLTAEAWNNFKAELDDVDYPVEAYFGTNEFYVFENKKEVLAGFTIKEVFKEDMSALTSLFGKKYNKTISFGWTPLDSFD